MIDVYDESDESVMKNGFAHGRFNNFGAAFGINPEKEVDDLIGHI